MDTYLRRKKDMLFRNVNSLKSVDELLEDIDKSVGLPHKKIHFSTTPEILAAIFGLGSGIALSCIFLYVSGSVLGFSPEGISSALKAAGAIVGGNDTVGIFMIMLPILVLGGIGFQQARHYRDQRLKESKIYFYKRALAKQALLKNEIFKSTHAFNNMHTEQNDNSINQELYVSSLQNHYIALQQVIRDIKHDLGIV